MDRMLASMTMRQFSEWGAYAELEPFDEERADYRAGSIVKAIYDVHRKKGAPPTKLKDCVLHFVEPAAAKTPEQARASIMRTMEILVAIHNGEVQRKSKPRVRRAE